MMGIPMGAAAALVTAKFRGPRLSASTLPRPRIVERLERAAEHPVSLLCAAAGSGKSVAIAQWKAHTALDVAYLGLDEADGDPQRFVGYLLASPRRCWCPSAAS